jgi:hypothetical protein
VKSLFSLLALTVTVALGSGCAASDGDELSDDLTGADAQAFMRARDDLRVVRAALRKTDADDARVASVLRKIGPALTPAQQAKYTSEFYKLENVRSDRKDLAQRAATAEKSVSALVQNKPLFNRIVAGSYVGVIATKNDLYEAFETLAQTPSSRSACRFGNAILSGKEGFAAFADKKAQVTEEILVPACGREAAEDLADGATAEDSLSELVSLGGAVGAAAAAVLEARTSHLRYPSSRRIAAEAPGRLVSALVATYTIYSAGTEATEGEYTAALKSLAEGSADIVEGVVDAVSLYRQLVLGGKALRDVSAFTGPLAGGITILVSSLSALEGLEDLDATSAKVKLAADCINILGGALLLVDFGTTSSIVLALGASVSFAAKMLNARELSAAERQDRDALLPKLGLSPNALTTLRNPNEAALGNLALAKLTPAQIQSLLKASAAILQKGFGNVDVDYRAVPPLAKGLGWSAATITQLFSTLLADSVEPEEQVAFVLLWTEGPALQASVGKGKSEVLRAIDRNLSNVNSSAPMERAAKTLRAFVAAH